VLSHVIRFALSQRLLAMVLAVLLAGGGVWAFFEIPIDAYPDISTTQVQVIVKAPGMSPVEVEQRVTYPIETQVRGIPHQTVLRSTTKYALSVITIDFEDGTDIYWARQQVSERINQVLNRLPSGVEGGLAPITSPLSELFMFQVEGEGRSNRELRSILDWMIRPRLLAVDGVADVNSLGGEVRSFQVRPRPVDLKRYELSVHDVARALRKNNENAGGDRLVRHHEVLLVRTIGRLRTLADIREITVATRGGVPVHVSDVAEVAEGALIRYGGVTADGKGEGVQGLVLLRRGANGRKTVEGVKAALAEIQKSLPEGVKTRVIYDRAVLIERAVGTVRNALGQAVALVLVVLLLFLGNLRSAVTAGMVLPLTVLGVFIPMHLLGISANLMSLGGLAIAIGVLVDSAVVMTENIHSQLSEDRHATNRLHVVYRAAADVARPVLAGVAIIAVSLVPILSLTGIEGRLFNPLASTIGIALITSLFLSLTVIPVLASLLMKPARKQRNWLLRALLRAYRPAVAWAVRRRYWALGIALAMLAAASAIVPFVGREFIPTLNEGTVVIQTEKLPTISLQRSLEIDLKMQRALMEVPEVVGIVSRTGSDELRLDPMGLNETDSFLVLKPRDQWTVDSTEALQEKLRRVLERFPGVNYGFTQPIDMRVSEMLTGVRAALAVKLFGEDLAVLERKARAIEQVVQKTRGAVDVVHTPLTGQHYLQVEMRRDVMSREGVTVDQINALIGTAVGGAQVTEIRRGVRRIPVVVRLPEAQRNRKQALRELVVRTADGGHRLLGELTRIREVDGPVQIRREGSKRMVVIRCNVKDRDLVGFVAELRRRIEDKVQLPPGYFVEFGGQFENQRRATRRLLLVIPLAIFAVFLLLFSTFGSVRQALIILLNIPFATIGGVTLLWLSGLYLSVPASVGFIALFGMAVMNGVVLVNHINTLRKQGLDTEQAVQEGGADRLRPVLMTAILTVLGLVPLLLATGPGSEIQQPLAVVVVGGTFSSTALTLLLIPTLYAWIEGRAERKARDRASQRAGS